MKYPLIFTALLFASPKLSGQTEIKVNPIAALFEALMVSVEHGFTEDFGLDADLLLIDGDGGFNISQKYYFNPNFGFDRFHVGAFETVQGGQFGIGFLTGYKWVSRRKVVFEIGLGFGRGFEEDDLVGYFKLHLGYRFDKKGKATKVE